MFDNQLLRVTRASMLALAVALGAITPAAQAQTTPGADTAGYPSKPVRILVGFPPGASTDAIARYVADILAKAFNKPFLVDNRPGAGGNIAAEVARSAAPDGHTLVLVIAGHVTNRGLYKSLPYEPIRDFTPVNLVARIPFILVAHTSFPGNSVTDIIAIAKSKPGALDYATAGIGSSQHLSGEQFARLSGARWNHVAYKGGAPALLAVASNEVPLALLTTTLVMPMLQKGAIKPIAIAAPTRSPMLPNVPTFAESGMPNYTADTWYGLLAPAGTPQALVNRLNAELSNGLASKEVRDKFAAQDAYIINAPPAEFAKVMQEDDAKWLTIVREARIQAQ
jgi:tripartite-type tricarboxylate transporter receptor subunit TctC